MSIIVHVDDIRDEPFLGIAVTDEVFIGIDIVDEPYLGVQVETKRG